VIEYSSSIWNTNASTSKHVKIYFLSEEDGVDALTISIDVELVRGREL
jgi:hypothetical protein